MANILDEVQHYVADKLNTQLSDYCVFLAENRKDIDFEIKKALGKQGIVGLVMTPKAVFAGKFEDQSIAWELPELEIDIVENVSINRGRDLSSYMTGQDSAMELFNILCPLSGNQEGQFCPVSYEEGEDGNLIVNKCVLKCLVHSFEIQPVVVPTALEISGNIITADISGVLTQEKIQSLHPYYQNFTGLSAGTEVSAIGPQCCSNIRQLGTVYLPSNVKKIGYNAFYTMSSKLSSVTIDEGLDEIERETFMNCSKLKDLVVPASVTRIGYNAFSSTGLSCLAFKGKRMSDVTSMTYYPWGISDTNIISAEL